MTLIMLLTRFTAFFFSLHATSVWTISKRFTVFFRNYRHTGCTLIKILAEQSCCIAFSAKDLRWQQSFKTKMLNQDLCGFAGRGVVFPQIICLSRNIKTGECTSWQIFQECYFYGGGWGRVCGEDSEQGSSEHQKHIWHLVLVSADKI